MLAYVCHRRVCTDAGGFSSFRLLSPSSSFCLLLPQVDPWETTNFAKNASYADIVAKLRKVLRAQYVPETTDAGKAEAKSAAVIAATSAAVAAASPHCTCTMPPHGAMHVPGVCAAKDPTYKAKCSAFNDDQYDCSTWQYVCAWQGVSCTTNTDCTTACDQLPHSGGTPVPFCNPGNLTQPQQPQQPQQMQPRQRQQRLGENTSSTSNNTLTIQNAQVRFHRPS